MLRIGHSIAASASASFVSLSFLLALLTLSLGRMIFIKVLLTTARFGGVKTILKVRIESSNNRAPASWPCVRMAASSKAILMAKGVGTSKLLPPDEVELAGFRENSVVEVY